MAIKKYLVKNKKRNISLILALIMFVATIFGVNYVKDTKAGVFVKDEDGNTMLLEDINVLEIVAQYGQQILGYTVEGQEPITKEQINNYVGDMDMDVEDFKNATGYVVEKEKTEEGKFKYTVLKSQLNDTFNKNVLGSSMAPGHIHINVKQASEVTKEDINNANLIFINSNDYNANLLYYYDQFVYGGELGIDPEDRGANYNQKYNSISEKYVVALSKISAAAGDSIKAAEIKVDELEYVSIIEKSKGNIIDFKSYNMEAYKQKIASLEENYFDDKDMISELSNIVSEVNVQCVNDAIQEIRNSATKATVVNEQERMAEVFRAAELEEYIPENIGEYCQYLASMTSKISSGVAKNIPKNVNGSVLVSTLPLIRESVKLYKEESTKIVQAGEEGQLTEEQIAINESAKAVMAEEAEKIQLYLKKINLGVINDLFATEYLSALTSVEVELTGSDALDIELIRDIINSSNENGGKRIKQMMANMLGDKTEVLFSVFQQDAEAIFEYLELENYNKYYLSSYVQQLYKLEAGGLSDENGDYSQEKLEEFLLNINKNTILPENVTMSGDISWKVANYLYESVMQEKVALMYNTDILTSKTIGDYADKNINDNPDDVSGYDNTNNMYKMLLLMRQIRYEYYTANIASKIDARGAYYEKGISDDTVGVLSWNKYTFGSDFENYEKYREPDVVGQTYAADGTKGNNTNYVYKRIYSFTGKEFFGGKAFNEIVEEISSGILTPDLGYEEGTYTEDSDEEDTTANSGIENEEDQLDYVENTDIIFLNATNYRYDNSYAFFYDNDNNTNAMSVKKMKMVNKNEDGKFYVAVPKEAKYVLFSPYENNPYDGNATVRIRLTDGNRDGVQYYIKGEQVGKKYCVNVETGLQYFDNAGRTVYLDASVLGWQKAYVYMWGEGDPVLQEMKYDEVNGLFFYDVPDGKTDLYFRNSNNWNDGNNSLNIRVDNILKDGKSYLVKLTGECCATNHNDFKTKYIYAVGTDEGKAMSAVMLTNSITYRNNLNDKCPGVEDLYSRVLYNGNIEIKAKFYNATNVKFKNASEGVEQNTDYTDLSDGGVINIGSFGTTDAAGCTQLEFKYTPYGSTSEVDKVCFYRQRGKAGYFSIDNFINNGTIEYVDKMDMTFIYKDVTDVFYQIDGGDRLSLESGRKLEFGVGEEADATHKITVTFRTGGEIRTISTTIVKVNPSKVVINYLSRNTATNAEKLEYDNTLSEADNAMIVGASKGDIIRFLLGVSITEFNFPIKVLEIQPGAAVTTLDSYDGAKKLASYFNASIPEMNGDNYKNYFDVRYMSVKEFNTRNDDLTSTYDLIYFGTDTGYQVLKEYTLGSEKVMRTNYRDKKMNGLVYTGIGDKYDVEAFCRGTSATDYRIDYIDKPSDQNTDIRLSDYRIWTNYYFDGFRGNSNEKWNLKLPGELAQHRDDYGRIDVDGNGQGNNQFYLMKSEATTTRLGGNDITVKKMKELLEYLKSGYPILMEDEIINCVNVDRTTNGYIDYDGNISNAKKWKYVDDNSKMFNFILEAKLLGYDKSTNTYCKSEDFYDGSTSAGLVAVSTAKSGGNPEYLATGDRFKGGLGFAYKRIYTLDFEFASGPQDYRYTKDGDRIAEGSIGTMIATTDPEYTKYEVVININTENNTGVSESQLDRYGYAMYIDKSGVGKFEDNDSIELMPTYEYIKNSAGKVTAVKLKGNWPGATEGFVPWKVDVFNKNNTQNKYEYIGYSAFQNKSSAVKDIYVLWIRPNGGNLKLNFKDQVSANKDALESAGYRLHIVTMKYDEFDDVHVDNNSTDEIVLNPDKKYDDSTTKLKVRTLYDEERSSTDYDYAMDDVDSISEDKVFDMMVIGFSDSYELMDFKRIATLKDVDYFLEAGHSLLFTHDNSSLFTSVNFYIGNNEIYRNVNTSDDRGGKQTFYDYNVTRRNPFGRYLTSYMRDVLGMDQYGVSIGNDGVLTEETSRKDMYVNARKYINTTNMDDYRGFSEICTFHYTSDGSGNKLYSDSLHSESEKTINNWCHTNKIMRTNEGQITDYPFVLGDTMSVAKTHAQYITLNVESPDITVWYTLDNDGSVNGGGCANPEFYKWTKGDGTNNYYIYSNGNITYTGAGHEWISEDKEIKLFINTIVAAIKAGNYEPDVHIYNTTPGKYNGEDMDYITYYSDSSGISVPFMPVDYDMKPYEQAFTDCKIFVDINGDGKFNNDDILLNAPDNYLIKNSENDGIEKYIGTEMKNRKLYTFLIPNDTIDKVNQRISEIDSEKNIKDYQIVIAVRDKGYLKSKRPIPAEGYGRFMIQEKEPVKVFNLK